MEAPWDTSTFLGGSKELSNHGAASSAEAIAAIHAEAKRVEAEKAVKEK